MSGVMYSGTTEDGSDMYPTMGVFVSPDGNEWSSNPYTKEQKLYQELYFHLSKNLRYIEEEYELIQQKKSLLSAILRKYVINLMKTENE
jgi:hypothetical protein